MNNNTLKRKLDQHILKLINKYVDNGTIKSKAELYEKMNIKKQNIYRIKKGYAHFTFEHIHRLRSFLNIDANELFNINEIQ